jgi:hypothetical protein
MKGILITLFGCLVFSSYSQMICKTVDEFTDKESYSSDGITYYDNENPKNGFYLYTIISKRGKKMEVGSIICTVVFDGNCVDEGDELFIIFEGGEKIKLSSWYEFNCQGTLGFMIPKDKEKLFKTNKISKMKFLDNNDYHSVTISTFKEEGDESYFTNLYKEIDEINNGKEIPICMED